MIRQVICIFLGLSLACDVMAGESKTFDKVSELIPKLGAKEWADREKAQEKIFLIFADDAEPAVSAVAEGYISTKDPEIRLRLEKILHRMAPEHVRLGQRGFLGVSLGKTGGTVKVGNEVYGPIDIVGVLNGTAAMAAGIAAGERILSIDDFKCGPDTTVEEVVKYISSRGPGAELRFVNLTRDEKVKARNIVLGDRPSRPDDPAQESIKQYMITEWIQGELRKAKLKQKQKSADKQ